MRQSVLLQRPLTGPMEVGLILTYRCNHGCTFCALPHEAGNARGEMNDQLLSKVIDDLAAVDCEQISLTGGGEPMMHPSTPALVERIRGRGMACSVCTNGSLLTDELVEKWAALGVHLAVSFNAASPETYLAVHRGAKPGTYERILGHMRDFARLAATNGGEGSLLSLNFVVHNANLSEIEAMAKLARLAGAAQIQYRLIQPRQVHRHLMLTRAELDRARLAVREVEKQAAASDFTVQIAESLREPSPPETPAGELQAGVVPQASFDDRTRVPCIEGYIASYIDADGTVFPCCLRAGNISNHYMGDIQKESFGEIWHGEAYRGFRRESFTVDLNQVNPAENSCAHCPKAKHFLYLVDEFAPGNYLDLTRRKIDEMQKQTDDWRLRLGELVKLPPAAMRAMFVTHEIPKRLAVDSNTAVAVTVKNTGESVWPGAEMAGDHPVGLGYHLLDKSGRMVRFDNNPRAYLANRLLPGEQVSLQLSIKMPAEPGKYQVELAMVQEQVGWFEQAGGATCRVSVQVEA